MLEFLPLFILGAVICLSNSRKGFYVCLLVGLLQDPARKMMPGEPVYFTVLVGVFVAVTYLGILMRNQPFGFGPVHAWNGLLRRPISVFMTWVGFQALITFAKTGSVVLPGIGIMSYLAPFATLLLGYHLTREERDFLNYARVYLALCIAMMGTVFLSVLGYDWKLLKVVGPGLHAYSTEGVLQLHSGFFRGSELAGWHGATAVCLLVTWFVVARPRLIAAVGASGLIIVLLLAVFFTGRRKFLVEVGLFLASYGVLTVYFRQAVGRIGSLVLLLIFAAFMVMQYLFSPEIAVVMDPYLERSLQVQEEAPDRVTGLTIDAFRHIISRNGWLGAGAGLGSQGAQYFGGGASAVGSAAEGGLGKVVAELGVPGLVLLVWLFVNMGRYLWAVLRHVHEQQPYRAPMVYALCAFLMANWFVFSISHQIYGDLFVLLLLGWMMGAALAVPRFRPLLSP